MRKDHEEKEKQAKNQKAKAESQWLQYVEEYDKSMKEKEEELQTLMVDQVKIDLLDRMK